MSDSPISRLLVRAREGDEQAEAELADALAPELRRLAHEQLRRRPDSLLESAALVNEIWIRLCGDGVRDFEGRLHFLRAAARTMRSVLVDRARSRTALKRGGGGQKQELVEDEVTLEEKRALEDLLALDDALATLAPDDRALAELRLFAGLSCGEIAGLGLGAERSLQRRWGELSARLKLRLGRREETR